MDYVKGNQPPTKRLQHAMEKYGITGDRELYHKLLGYFSGIPACCINFFITRWSSICGSAERYRRFDKWCEKKDAKLKYRVSYRRCPTCVATGFYVKIDCDYIWKPKLRTVREDGSSFEA